MVIRIKKTTMKQRLIRLLDRISNHLKPVHVPISEGEHIAMVDRVGSKTLGNGLEVTSISLVTHCPYCGTDDWDTPKLKRNGSMCNHPTRLTVVK